MSFIDFLKRKNTTVSKDTGDNPEDGDEYTIPDLVPIDFAPMRNLLAERRAQEELLHRYGIDRAGAGSI